jgi:hypothetical protein
MQKKNLAGALIASLSLPLMLATFSVPLANAAGVSSTVATVDNCKWVMANIPGEILMTSADNAKFNGDALAVSADLAGPTLGLSGSTSTVAASADNTECSFYNSVLDASLSANLDTIAFAATFLNSEDAPTEDTAMNFDLSSEAPLAITPNITSCTVPAGWTKADVSFTASGVQQLIGFTSLENEYAADVAPRCAPPGTITLTIPARDSVPQGAGSQYSFSGPSITFSSTPSNSFNYVLGAEPVE